MNTASFSISEALGFGWAMVKEKFLFLLAIIVVSGVFAVVPDVIDNFTDNQGVLFFMQVVSVVLGFVIDAGLISVMLSLYDGRAVKIADIFSQYPITFRYFVANVVYGIMVFAGLLLLVIPGVYLALRYQFYKYFLIDKRTDVVESLRESARITEGHKWQLLRFALVILAVNLLGFLALIVGLLVTMPLSMLATVYVYRKLSSPIAETESEQEEKEFLAPIEKESPVIEKVPDSIESLAPIE
ncbi:MAG: hypothetical protein PHT88_02610 [Candidatus Moranbacteria bacterium]|nr:hypothetical protein [Candidatus Moranbacteria bacterium]